MLGKVLLLGGSGLLGTELRKHLKCDAPTHKQLDITKEIEHKDYELVIHAAAYTDVVKAETDTLNCLDVNVFGLMNLLETYQDTPFVYISTEYAKNPVNFYSKTKQLAERIIEFNHRNYHSAAYLIIRTLFKPNPFPWNKAFIDQYTQGDYVDIIAPLIVKEIWEWDKVSSKTIYVGTGRKTMFDLAKRTKPDVLPCSVNDIKEVKLPKDYLWR